VRSFNQSERLQVDETAGEFVEVTGLPFACTQRIGRPSRDIADCFHGEKDSAGIESHAAVTLEEAIDG
jgi:hypothetical protein